MLFRSKGPEGLDNSRVKTDNFKVRRPAETLTLLCPGDFTIESAISLLRREGHVQPGDKLIVATDILAQDRLVDSVQLRTVR